MTWTPYQQLGYIEGIRPSDKRRRSQDEVLMEAKARAKVDHERRRQELAIETERKKAKLRNATWTHEDLVKLMYHQEKILDTHFGEPQAFEDDKTQIDALLAKRKGEIKLEGIEKDSIQAEGVDYLYGLLIQEHILDEGFYVEIDKDHQPIVHCNEEKPDKDRQAKRDGLQKVLQKFEFQHDVNSPLRKNDNISKVAVYMTAAAYHGQEQKNLIKYREKLEEDLQKDPNKPLTADEIKKSDLSTKQKSFLLMWKDRKYDANLISIQDGQEKYVKNAREINKDKTMQQIAGDVIRDPIKALPMLLAGGFVAACLYGAYRLLKKGGFFATIGAIFLGAIGGTMAVTAGGKLWQSTGVGDYIADRIEGKPVDREKANDHIFAGASGKLQEQWNNMKQGVENFTARISGGQEWMSLVTNPKLEPIMKECSVGSVLYVLSSDGSDKNKYRNFEPKGAEKKKIEETLKKVRDEDRPKLLKFLETSWNRHMKLNPELREDPLEAKKLKLPAVIESIDQEDGWINKAINAFSDNDEAEKALVIMAPKGKEWGELTIEELHYHLLIPHATGDDPIGTDAKIIPLLYSGSEAEKTILIKYLEPILRKNEKTNKNTRLKTILSQ